MFVQIPFEVYVRVAGAVVAVGCGVYENKGYIWKKTHQQDYRYLCSRTSFGGPVALFDRWLEYNLWNIYSKEKILEKYDYFTTSLHGDRIYQNAPASVQAESNRIMRKFYDEACEEIDRKEALARKRELDWKLAQELKKKG